MDKNPLKYGQNVVLGNLSSLGKLSIWAKNIWAKCLHGQIVILGMMSLGKMLPWAIYLWAFWKVGHFNFQSNFMIGESYTTEWVNIFILFWFYLHAVLPPRGWERFWQFQSNVYQIFLRITYLTWSSYKVNFCLDYMYYWILHLSNFELFL